MECSIKRPMTASEGVKTHEFDISQYLTCRQLIKMKHKPKLMFQQAEKENKTVNMIINRGPSILGSKAITNTRPQSSCVKLRPFNQIDNKKISKLATQMLLAKSQTYEIQTILQNDKSQYFLKLYRSKNKQTIYKRKCFSTSKSTISTDFRPSTTHESFRHSSSKQLPKRFVSQFY